MDLEEVENSKRCMLGTRNTTLAANAQLNTGMDWVIVYT